MKLNKTFGRIATTLVATAMLASMAVVPASAANNNGVITDGSGVVSAITFTKELVRPANVATPNVTFTFDLTGAEATGGETASDGTTTVAVLDGTDHGSVENVQVEFDANSAAGDPVGTAPNQTVTVTETVTMNLTAEAGFTFTAPGVYKYTLTEDTVTGYTTSPAYTVYLYVERVETPDQPDQFVITGATMFSGTSEDTKTDTMVNYYLTDPEGNVTPNSLTVNKTVTGDMGDKNKEFEFVITITAKDNATDRNYTVTGANPPVNKGDGTYTVTGSLKNSESLTINGLIEGDSYVVNETEAGRDGYTTTVTGDATSNGQSVNFDDTDADTVSYTNHRDAVSPTGLVMDIAPYVLLVVVAAAGCFVFLRKRRED